MVNETVVPSMLGVSMDVGFNILEKVISFIGNNLLISILMFVVLIETIFWVEYNSERFDASEVFNEKLNSFGLALLSSMILIFLIMVLPLVIILGIMALGFLILVAINRFVFEKMGR